MDKRNGWNNGQRWLTNYYGKSYTIDCTLKLIFIYLKLTFF